MIREYRRGYGGKTIVVISKYNKEKAHLLSIVDKHAEPCANFAVGAQQQATDVGHQRADCLICSVWPVVQSESHAQARQVALFHLTETT